jgi:hypothetical protein
VIHCEYSGSDIYFKQILYVDDYSFDRKLVQDESAEIQSEKNQETIVVLWLPIRSRE